MARGAPLLRRSAAPPLPRSAAAPLRGRNSAYAAAYFRQLIACLRQLAASLA
jgi:hypothetical protein